MVVRAFAKTDVGRVREHNEDNHLVDEMYQVYAVADGMGGHAGGAQASALAVATLSAHLRKAGGLLLDDALAQAELEALTQATPSHTPIDVLADEARVPSGEDGGAGAEANGGPEGASPRAGGNDSPGDADVQGPDAHSLDPHDLLQEEGPAQAISIPYVVYDVWDPGIAQDSVAPVITRMLSDGVRLACRTIFEAAQENVELMGMGTTVTVLCLHKNWAYVAHVGDSRCYMQRGSAMMQVTEDHSLVNEQIKAGLISAEEARYSRHKNIITRSVGFEPDVEVDCFVMPTQPDDKFLLCSDGLSNLIEEEELAESMAQLRGHSLINFLVELALGRGGDDNITVISVEPVATEADGGSDAAQA